MIARYQRQPASGAFRMLGLLLLLGVAAMHAGVFALGSDCGSRAAHHSTMAAVPVDQHGAAPADGDHGHATATHPCVFIEAAAVLTVVVALLYRLGSANAGTHLPVTAVWRLRRRRSPPWHTPSLAELSILRI